MICYDPLWKTMKEKHISQYQLLKRGIDHKTLDSLKKGKIGIEKGPFKRAKKGMNFLHHLLKFMPLAAKAALHAIYFLVVF